MPKPNWPVFATPPRSRAATSKVERVYPADRDDRGRKAPPKIFPKRERKFTYPENFSSCRRKRGESKRRPPWDFINVSNSPLGHNGGAHLLPTLGTPVAGDRQLSKGNALIRPPRGARPCSQPLPQCKGLTPTGSLTPMHGSRHSRSRVRFLLHCVQVWGSGSNPP